MSGRWGREERGRALESNSPFPGRSLPAPPLSYPAVERADFAKRAQEAEARAAATAASAAELRTAAAKASGQHSLLQKHLEMLRGSLQEASTQMEADRQRYQQHLSQLRAALQAYEAHLAQRQGGGAAGAAEQEAADAVAVAAGQATA